MSIKFGGEAIAINEGKMDLTKFNVSEEPQKLVILDPNTIDDLDPKPITDENGDEIYLLVLSPESAEYRSINRELERKIEEAKKSKKPIDGEDATMLRITSLIKGGSPTLTLKGKPISYTAQECKELIETLPWLMTQISRYIVSRENFTKKPE